LGGVGGVFPKLYNVWTLCNVWTVFTIDFRTNVLYYGCMFTPAVIPLSPAPPRIYRQYFTAEERKMLDASPLDSAISEISLLRILLLRLLAAAGERASGEPRKSLRQGALGARRTRPLSIGRRLSMLSAFSGAALIMASLVRFHDKYFGFGSANDPFLQALAEMDPDDL
jgi:hypothetical protein